MSTRNEVDNTGMRPRVGQTTMQLPITFDYQGGRRNKDKVARVWAAILGVLAVIFFIGILLRDGNIISNFITAVLVAYTIVFIIRFPLLKENIHRKEKIQLIDSDNELPISDFWGIYDFSDIYPYIARFRNGKSGMFVLLHKDVILGKYSQAEHEHYEAIGDAYNIAASSKISISHIDYMDLIGSDDRLDESFKELESVRNVDLKDLLTDIFTYQQEVMSSQASTFDAYLFLWSGNDDSAWDTIQRILSCFLDANYRGYKILNKADVRELTKVGFNLDDFSVEKGMLGAFSVSEEIRCVTPIKVINEDGSEEILNKTTAERKQDMENKARAEELRKEEIKARRAEKRKKPTSGTQGSDDEEIDLF